MPLAAYLDFLSRNARFAGFGFLAAFGSSFGQTYFIGVFGPHVQAEFALSHTDWGTLYMLGTLASAAVLPWSGRLIDRLDLRLYTVLVMLLLGLACLVTSRVAGVASLVVAVFLLRQSGQGLMSHIALTSMARYFHAERGRAIALATTGFAAGEALLPFAAVAVIGVLGWRGTYQAIAVAVLALVPIVLWLAAGHGERHRLHVAAADAAALDSMPVQRSWSRAEVLRDRRFWLLLPGLLAPALIVTALFFHHLNIADAKGWSHAWVTGSYVVYAAVTTLVSVVCGALVDRLGALRLLPFMLLPLVAALLVLWAFDTPWILWPYLALAGVNVGIAHTATSAMWAELYGTRHLGAIKSMAGALGVFGSALGPIAMGALADRGMPIDRVCVVFAAYALGASVLMAVAVRGKPRVATSPP